MNEQEGYGSSHETEWLVVYNTLLKEHVTFPSRETKIAPKAQTHRNYAIGNSPMIAESEEHKSPMEEEQKNQRQFVVNASEARDLIR